MADQPTSFERQMERINSTIVFIKNIDKEDFTHPYAGFPYTLHAGETLAFPYPLALHLAKHLAMKILRQGKIKSGEVADKDRQGKPTNLYKETELDATINRIIQKKVEQDIPAVVDEGEVMRRKTEAVQKQFIPDKPPAPKVDKKEVIKLLTERGIKFDARSGLDALLTLVAESEKTQE